MLAGEEHWVLSHRALSFGLLKLRTSEMKVIKILRPSKEVPFLLRVIVAIPLATDSPICISLFDLELRL